MDGRIKYSITVLYMMRVQQSAVSYTIRSVILCYQQGRKQLKVIFSLVVTCRPPSPHLGHLSNELWGCCHCC